MQTAQVIPLQNQFAVVEFELTPRAITEMVKEYEHLQVIPDDAASYKEVRAALTTCIRARTGTDKRRLELGADAREWIKEVNSKAGELIEALAPLENRLRGMLEEEDNRKAEIEASEARDEQKRVDEIDGKIETLKTMCKSGLEYNLNSDRIKDCLDSLEVTPLSSLDYQERWEEAETIKQNGIDALESALAARLQFETEQAAQEAERKRLADERAKFEADRVAEREKQAAAQAKIDAEQEALDKEKARILAEKKAQEDAEALKAQIEADHAQAVIDNAEFDTAKAARMEQEEADRKEKLKADEARAKLIAKDKALLEKYFYSISAPEFNFAQLKTETALDIFTRFATGLDGLVMRLSTDIKDLA